MFFIGLEMFVKYVRQIINENAQKPTAKEFLPMLENLQQIKKLQVLTLEKQKTIGAKQINSLTRSKFIEIIETHCCPLEFFKKWMQLSLQ